MRRGFTLIELLVVIAIMAIFLAFLMGDYRPMQAVFDIVCGCALFLWRVLRTIESLHNRASRQ